MKLKHLALLVVVLAALSVATYFATRTAPPPSADTRVGQPLIAPALVEKTAQLKISDQGKSVILAKRGEGNWTVPAYYDFPADFQKLSGFVSDLTSAKIDQFVTSSPQRLSHLDFKDTQIAFLGSDNKVLDSITLGKNADAGGRFVRYGDESKAYRTNLNAWIDADPKSWANAALTPDLKADEIAKVEINFPGEPALVVTRAKKGDPFTAGNIPTHQHIAVEKISSLITSLTGLRFTDTTDLADANANAAKNNQRSVILTTFGGQSVTIGLGRKPEQKIIKAPSAKPDGKSGPAALGKVTAASTDKNEQGPAKALAPETETIPAGPVFAFVVSSDEHAAINKMMTKRAFQVYDYGFTQLPQKTADLLEAAPTPTLPPATTLDAAPAQAPTGTVTK